MRYERAESIIFGEISLWKPDVMQTHDVVRVPQHRDVYMQCPKT